MKMKKILIALVSVALFASCSADGVFSGGTLENPNVTWSNPDGPNPIPGGLINCQVGANCFSQQWDEATCKAASGTVVQSCPGTTQCSGNTQQYCYNYGDCDLIGGYWAKDPEECRSMYSGQVYSCQQCVNAGATFNQ
jgi:hypothetical protein